MKLKPAIHRAVCRWAAKRTLPKKNGVEPQAERKSSAPDYVARSGEHIRRTDRMLADFVRERYDLRFNVLDGSTELKRKEEPEAAFRTVSERESNTVCLEAHSAGIPCWDRDLLRFIHSSHVEAYHPFRQYFDRLPDWDGTDRLEALAMRVSSDPVWVSAFRRWMLGVAAQWSGLTDGMHALCVAPLLVSDRQGLGKSTFCKALLPPVLRHYYTDDVDLSSPGKMERRLVEVGLINLDEFDRISSKKQSLLKNLMQISALHFRKAYSAYNCTQPRLAAFIGTSNSRELLTDKSGNRRFICVSVEHPVDSTGIEHAQIYAQLKAELAGGARYWFDAEDEAALQFNNASYYRTFPTEELLRSCFRAPRPGEEGRLFSLTDMLSRIRLRCPGVTAGVNLHNFAQALTTAGVRKIHTQYGNRYRVVEVEQSGITFPRT